MKLKGGKEQDRHFRTLTVSNDMQKYRASEVSKENFNVISVSVLWGMGNAIPYQLVLQTSSKQKI